MDQHTRRELIERLNRDATAIAARFSLRYRAIEAERANVKSRYGVCYSDGTIKIRLVHAVSRRPLKYWSLVSTLCHELAHLRHFNHGPRFRSFYSALLEFARREGIYRPASRGPRSAAPPALRRPDAPEPAPARVSPPPAAPAPRPLPSPRPPRSPEGAGPRQLTLFG